MWQRRSRRILLLYVLITGIHTAWGVDAKCFDTSEICQKERVGNCTESYARVLKKCKWKLTFHNIFAPNRLNFSRHRLSHRLSVWLWFFIGGFGSTVICGCRLTRPYVCTIGFCGAYDYSGLERQVSGFITVSVSASGTCRMLDFTAFKDVGNPCPKTRETAAQRRGIQKATRTWLGSNPSHWCSSSQLYQPCYPSVLKRSLMSLYRRWALFGIFVGFFVRAALRDCKP